MEILLTQDDIDRGVRKNHRACPFARAFRRVFPNADDIEVWLYDVTVRHGLTVTRYRPDDDELFLRLDGYDAGHNFIAPGRYVFTQIDESTINL